MDFQQSFYQKPKTTSTSTFGRGNEGGPIQFVFIDESARDSKRLKITRACESCRRRKVKCDAPHVAPGDSCTSCKRLNVDCIMQSTTNDGEERATERSSVIDDETQQMKSKINNIRTQETAVSPKLDNDSPRSQNVDATSQPRSKHINSIRQPRSPSENASVRSDGDDALNSKPWESSNFSSLTDPASAVGVNSLTDIFGNLNIQLSGRATFLDDAEHHKMQHRSSASVNPSQPGNLEDFPVTFQEVEQYLPSEDLAMDLLRIYFDNVHPYLPVLNKTTFLPLWLSNRRKEISPYLLLSLFACAARYSSDSRVLLNPNDPATRGDMWYGLVLRYRLDFSDIPRLSTMQADVINLKALETRPKTKGYSYRGWLLLSLILRMGHDLGLHKTIHSLSNDPDTITRRRIWQICLIMDQMMGTAQGRDLQLDMAEVDLTLLPLERLANSEFDAQETRTHNNFVYLAGLMKIHRRCTEVHHAVGIKFPFAAEPQYPALADIIVRWRANLPQHLKFDPAVDKILPSHFIAHLHLSQYMITCLLHRPWIVSVGAYGATGEWKEHLRLCNQAARDALAVYEMLLDQYGTAGVQWMIRGTNYTMYGAVVITMIHAVCATCPEHEFCDGARSAFIRAVKVLDRLSIINPTSQFKAQLTALKQIFDSPAHSDDARIDPLSLPPELTSLQEQFQMMQEADFRHDRRGNTKRSAEQHEYNDYQGGYAAEASSFHSSYNEPVSRDAQYYHPVHDPASHMSAGPHQLSATLASSQSISAEQTDWNPAGLIGAWHLNFPSYDTVPLPDFGYTGHDGSSIPYVPTTGHEHSQQYLAYPSSDVYSRRDQY